MAVAEFTKKEQRYKRNDEVRQNFNEYMEKRRYPRMNLIAKDAGLHYPTLVDFSNGVSQLSNKSLDKLEEFMKHN
ncbi:hypothetical protein MKZ65_12745 [Staphylococcus haemolyticus]|uniref:hypothetical protein n=1 Tax=Staphylococcus haemolyticus TaxID=1283 RepID=UPI001F5DC076|nr:hypothetical protein [Staphylococcus haemolyticus]MCI3142606.1 hypothetical protein [Staphylococcus haemolyticus]